MGEEKQRAAMELRLRPPAFDLPTGCPKCLPAFFYLRLAKVAFTPVYSASEPDSDELPIVEFGDLAGFSNECGGIEEFLKTEKLADLDADLTPDERSDLVALRSLLLHLDNALAYELWSKENETVAAGIYLSHIPWPISKVIDWNMRTKAMIRLGINKTNAIDRAAQIYKEAFAAYDVLARKCGQPFFMNGRPTSLDALLLAHLSFVFSVPLENSMLSQELSKYPSLISYAENLKRELLKDDVEAVQPGSPRKAPRSPKASASSSSRKGAEAKNRKQTPKEKSFKRKAKQFIAAQIGAVLIYILLTSLQYGEDEADDLNDE